MKTKILSIAAIAMLLLSILAILPAYSAPVGTIYLDPATINYDTDTGHVGDKFQVTVKLQGCPDQLEGVQVKLNFNPNVVNITQWIQFPNTEVGYVFKDRKIDGLPTPPDAGYTPTGPNSAYVQVALSMNPAYPTPPNNVYGLGNGKVLIFEFEIKALPGKQGSLTTTLNLDNTDTYIILAGEFYGDDPDELTKQNCVYTITWKAPASPYMGLTLPTGDPDPAALVLQYGPDPPPAVGQFFNCLVQIKGLSAAWYLTGASFRLTYNGSVISIVGGLADITVAPLWGGSSVVVTEDTNPAVLDYVDVSVSAPSSNPSGTVLVITIKFTVMKQEMTPPTPGTYKDWSDLVFSNVNFQDHIGPIPPGTPEKGTVNVFPLRLLNPPWLEVVPSLVELGPDPSIGEEFEVGVKITGPPPIKLDKSWYLIGVQFRVFYDPELIEPVAVTEGPFLQNPTWNKYGTFFVGSIEVDGLGPHVAVGNMLLPNGTGDYDQKTFPNGEGIVAYIRFKALKQECPDPFECEITLTALFDEEWALDKNGNWIPCEDPVNGLYRMLPFDQPGRVIDLYGGAKNDGYWIGYPDPFTAPLGGQGPNHWMDLVFPQSEITLYAYVTYNYWPVQRKDVGFEIEGPYEKLPNGTLVKKQRWQIWAKFTATTDEDGIATLVYRMPWPCEDPDGITGIWKVTATVTLADELIMDTMIFYYERVVYITKVSTDKFYYTHGEYITVTVEYQTHSVQQYPILFAIVLTDDLGVPFGMAIEAGTIGGAQFCTWKPGDFSKSILIPKWAYAGYGLVHVSAYDKDPTEGGEPYCPENADTEFQIGPY